MMKKYFIPILISALLFIMQSCVVNSTITYHADSATTTEMNMDMREFIKSLTEMFPDSAQNKNDKNPMAELGKLPKNWTSIYDVYKDEGKEMSKDPDTIKLYKKIFLKAYDDNNETIGIAMKMDHFTKSDMSMLQKNNNRKEILLSDPKTFGEWDGKKLVINTEDMNLDSFRDSMPNSGDQKEMTREEEENFMKMMNIRFTNNLKFEKKIQSIVGKHDWIKKLDDYTIQIYFDSKMVYDKNQKMTNKDKIITITTE